MKVRICGTVVVGDLSLDLDLDVSEGVTMISGRNGAGKTTLLRLIAGLEALQSGTLDIAGRRVDDPAERSFVPTHERPVAMAFQDHRLFPHLSVIDNVAFPLRRRGMSRDDARTHAQPHVEAMGLGAHLSTKPRRLSIGQRQRAALARALATPAEVLLLDEPLASVDDDGRLGIRAHLRGLDNRCVLWVTHDPADAAHQAGHISIDGVDVRQTLNP